MERESSNRKEKNRVNIAVLYHTAVCNIFFVVLIYDCVLNLLESFDKKRVCCLMKIYFFNFDVSCLILYKVDEFILCQLD